MSAIETVALVRKHSMHGPASALSCISSTSRLSSLVEATKSSEPVSSTKQPGRRDIEQRYAGVDEGLQQFNDVVLVDEGIGERDEYLEELLIARDARVEGDPQSRSGRPRSGSGGR